MMKQRARPATAAMLQLPKLHNTFSAFKNFHTESNSSIDLYRDRQRPTDPLSLNSTTTFQFNYPQLPSPAVTFFSVQMLRSSLFLRCSPRAVAAALRNAHAFPAFLLHARICHGRMRIVSQLATAIHSVAAQSAPFSVCVRLQRVTRGEKCRIEECLLCNFARSDVLCPPSTRPPRCAAIRRSSWRKRTSPWCDNILPSWRHSCYLNSLFHF
jgi:hypothetical protein